MPKNRLAAFALLGSLVLAGCFVDRCEWRPGEGDSTDASPLESDDVDAAPPTGD